MRGHRSMFFPRFVHGSNNEELIVRILGNESLSFIKNSPISWSSIGVSHGDGFFFLLRVE